MSQPLGHGVWSLSQGLFIHENVAIVEFTFIDFDDSRDGIVCVRIYAAAEADNGYVANVNIAVFYASAGMYVIERYLKEYSV